MCASQYQCTSSCFDVFGRTYSKHPFLLLDGHHSRFEIPFLDYICNNQHNWQLCIGVPYGIFLWQVLDSKEYNGSYKIALAQTKKEFFEKNCACSSTQLNWHQLISTDIIPLINNAWSASFARVNVIRRPLPREAGIPVIRIFFSTRSFNIQWQRMILHFSINRKQLCSTDWWLCIWSIKSNWISFFSKITLWIINYQQYHWSTIKNIIWCYIP